MKKVLLCFVTLCTYVAAISQNPILLKDVYPGATGSGTQQIVKTSNYIFFNAEDDDADTDRGLYRTNGSAAGTVKLNLSYPTFISTKAEKLTPLGNKIIFAGDNFPNYGEIWASDGTQEGTIALERFQPTRPNTTPVVELATMGSYVYYSVIDGNNQALLKRTDGTPGGTSLVYNFNAFAAVPQVVFLTPVNGILYFIVYDAGGTGVDQLWRSDGTGAGTSMVYNFGPGQYVASYLMVAGNTMYVMIVKPGTGNVLWKSDGTAEGTVAVKTIGTSGNNNYPPFAAISSTLYFAGLDGNGKELWKTDGTSAGTILIADINAGSGNSNPAAMTVFNNTLYFSAFTVAEGNELWKFNGASAALVKDIFPGSASSNPFGFTFSNNTMLFRASGDASGSELWITDGTTVNTRLVRDINPTGSSAPSLLTAINNTVYFTANNGTAGQELYKFDNTDGIAGLNKIYVNDNSQTGDVITTAVGDNTNTGIRTSPVATVTYALSIAQPGDTIYVDAGNYAEQVIIDKGITIVGAGQNLTFFTPPASPLVPAPGPFTEIGLFETTQGIGDVHLRNLSINSNGASQNIIIQSGGSVSNCTLLNGGQGIFFRVEPAIKTALIENNIIQPDGIGINCQGSGLTATIRNNTISKQAGYYAGIFAGLDFGPIVQLTVSSNTITNYFGNGFLANSFNSNFTQNSIVGLNGQGIAIQQFSGAAASATCNWFGTSDANLLVPKISGSVTYSPWLTNGTDADVASLGFQPLENVCGGRQNKFYVNDNVTAADVFTTGTGSNTNSGIASAPFATINYALTKAQPGDTIYIDAGSFTEQVIVTKSITIRGAGRALTTINGPAAPLAPPPNFDEIGIIQSYVGIGDVLIEDLLVDGTNSDERHAILIQGGGRVSNCEMRNANNGFFFRDHSGAPSTALGINNYIHNISFVGILFAGNGMDATATSNIIDLNGAAYGMGFIAGYGGDGNLKNFTATNNSLINFNGLGMLVSTLQPAQIHSNSITRITGNFFQNISGITIDATCNWFGTTDANIIVPNMSGSITYSSWLTNGTDADIATIGFQPLQNVCGGRQNKFYVNNNTVTGDVFTTAVGNNTNTGVASAPFATIDYAYSIAQAGDTIYVDAGTYDMGGLTYTFSKAVTLLGTNYQVTPNDAGDKLQPNTSRNAESIVTNLTLVVATNDLSVEGFTVAPGNRTFLSLANANYGGLKFRRNHVKITGSPFVFSLSGVAATNPALLTASDYLFSDNRFDRSGTGSGSTFYLNYLKNVVLSNNSVVITGPTTRAQNFALVGQVGVVDSICLTDNVIDRANYNLFSLLVSRLYVTGNKFYNANRDLFIQANVQGSSDILVENNEIVHNLPGAAINTIISVSRFSGNAAASNVARIRNNNILIDATGINFLPAAINGFNAGTLLNPVLEISDNKITHSGNFSSLTSIFSGISISGNLLNTTVNANELVNSGTNYLLAPINGSAATSSGIQMATDAGINSVTSAAIININNNKVSGYKQSVILYDFSAIAPNTYTGYGNLPTGVTVNIDNNSFAGDSISINNGNVGASVNATCNWYGTAAAQTILTKVSSNSAQVFPYLTNGTDTDAATGFQPTANTCDGSIPLITLNSFTYATCFGAANGSVNITASLGKAPFVFTWTKVGDANFISNDEDPTNFAAGTYRLAVTDANGTPIYKTSIESAEPGILEVIIAEPSAVTAAISNTSTACSNIATVTAGGGTPGYTYLWSNGSTSATISGVPVGTYTVTVTDANGCTATATITLTVAEAFNPSASVTNVTCFGANDGVITVTNINGTAPFMFSKDGGINFENGSLPFSFTNLAPGNYTIAVKDANGCVGFVERTVVQPTPLVATISNVQSTCFGTNTGAITMSVSGGVTAYGYSWTKIGGGFSSSQLNISGLAAGNYTLTVTDKNNCTYSIEVLVPANAEILVNESISNVTCRGAANGSIAVNASSGGNTNFSYLWNTGATTASIGNLAPGNYSVRVTDNTNSCFVNKSFTITQPALALSLATAKTNATGCNSLGTITASASGGTAPYTYSMNGTAITGNSIGALSLGDYNITVTDANGCTTSKVVTITDNGSDEFEGNNSKNQAKPISVGTTINARLALSNDAADWFTFIAPGSTSGLYSIKTMHPDLNVVYTVSVFASGKNTAALVPVSVITSGESHYQLTAGATYFVSITTTTLSYKCYSFAVSALEPIEGANRTQNNITTAPSVDILKAFTYPNPHNGNFTLSIESPEEGVATVELYTVNGQKLSERKANVVMGKGNTVKYSNMNYAILFYKVRIGKHTVTGKIISPN